jgi:hypothetical protein
MLGIPLIKFTQSVIIRCKHNFSLSFRQENKRFWGNWESSGWPEFIHLILKTSCDVVNAVRVNEYLYDHLEK